MNIICITTGMRPDLLQQTLASLKHNAAIWTDHRLTVVWDGPEVSMRPIWDTLIVNAKSQGASACRNSGAGSIPESKRQDFLMFVDDDCFFVKDWDRTLVNMAFSLPEKTVCSLYGHPFNGEDEREGVTFAKFPLVISSVAMFMSWKTFTEIGPWPGEGGPGGSEDWAICDKARNSGYDFAVSNPHACIHTGLWSSNGLPIVGHKELALQNEKLLKLHGLDGKVIFG